MVIIFAIMIMIKVIMYILKVTMLMTMMTIKFTKKYFLIIIRMIATKVIKLIIL